MTDTPEQIAEWKRLAVEINEPSAYPTGYIPRCRTAIPALIAEVERLTAERDALKAEMSEDKAAMLAAANVARELLAKIRALEASK